MNNAPSKTQMIIELLNIGNDKNNQIPLYKKTSNNFKKAYGIDLLKAPIVVKSEDTLWKLEYSKYVIAGRVVEDANYKPYVNVGEKFERFSNKNIRLN